MRGYQDLKVWQLGIEISLSVYRLTSDFPQRRRLWIDKPDASCRHFDSIQHC